MTKQVIEADVAKVTRRAEAEEIYQVWHHDENGWFQAYGANTMPEAEWLKEHCPGTTVIVHIDIPAMDY